MLNCKILTEKLLPIKKSIVENELKKLQKFGSRYYRGKNYFGNDGTQNYLVFQPMHKYLKITTAFFNNEISSWESKGLPNEKIASIITSNHSLTPRLIYRNARMRAAFTGNFLKQDKVTYGHRPILNIYTVYKLISSINTTGVTLEGAVKLTKNDDTDKYKYSGYGIGFDSRGTFSHPSGGIGKNIIFGVDMSKGFTQGLDNTTIYAEKMYWTNFTVPNAKFCLRSHYNGDDSYLFVNGKEIIKLKAEDSEIVPYPSCLESISKDFSPEKIIKTGSTAYVYDFSVDYWAITADKILDIHKYLMEKNNII